MSLPYQHVLLTPRSAHLDSSLPFGLGFTDLILAGLTLLTIYTQWMADNQQYHFQTYKQYVKKQPPPSASSSRTPTPRAISTYRQGPFDITWTPEDAERGFITRGLWAWSRHPNFACEMTFWALQGLFPLLAAQTGQAKGLRLGEKLGMVLPTPIIPAIAVSPLFP